MILFIVGMIYLLFSTNTYHQGVSHLREEIKENEVLYQQYVSDEKLVSYPELVSTLFQTLEYDLEIDGVMIRKQDHDAEKILSYGIIHADYQKTYAYDSKGNVIKVIFTEY